MREVGSSTSSGSGTPPSGEPPSSNPPPGSQRGFIGTNTDAAQAYVPPTAVRDLPEPPVPRTKVALAAEVDPRQAPTAPALKKAAQALAAEIHSERPPPMTEPASDAQPGEIRRGSGYAPAREASHRSPSTRPPARPRTRPPPPADPPETPAQKGAALVLTLLFAALLVIAAYFFLRKTPASQPDPAAPLPGSTASGAPPP